MIGMGTPINQSRTERMTTSRLPLSAHNGPAAKRFLTLFCHELE